MDLKVVFPGLLTLFLKALWLAVLIVCLFVCCAKTSLRCIAKDFLMLYSRFDIARPFIFNFYEKWPEYRILRELFNEFLWKYDKSSLVSPIYKSNNNNNKVILKIVPHARGQQRLDIDCWNLWIHTYHLYFQCRSQWSNFFIIFGLACNLIIMMYSL